MSSRSLVSAPQKRIKTEDGEDLENYVDLDLVRPAEVELNRAITKKDDGINKSPPKSPTDDEEKRSELAPVPHQMVVTDVLTLADCLPEAWKDIFDTLDSGDLLTCFRTSSKWRNLLGHKRTQLLFPEVASLLFPPNDPTLLECRKVCKSWKEDVDSQVHRSLVLLPFEKGAADESFTVVLETIETIRQFLDYSGNPFPWGSIKIGWNSRAQQNLQVNLDAYLSEFHAYVIQLLDAFGHYIYYVQFDLNFYKWQLGSPDLLREVLLRVPNLRRLQIIIQTPLTFKPEPVREYYAVNPLPQLVHLETLILFVDTMEYDAIPVLCSYIPPQSLSIKRMDVPRFYEAMHHFPNLEVYSGGWFNHEDLERFRNAALKPAFKKLFLELTVTIEEKDEARLSDFQQVFTSLALFSESLEYLRISRCGFGTLTLRDNDFRINLPKLKFLRIDDFDSCLDTLIELSSLRDLEVEFAHPGLWDGDTITVLGIRKQVNDSNIWELLPTLENLIVRVLYEEVEPRKYKRDFSTGLIVEVEYEGTEYNSSEDTDDEGDESGENDEEGDESTLR